MFPKGRQRAPITNRLFAKRLSSLYLEVSIGVSEILRRKPRDAPRAVSLPRYTPLAYPILGSLQYFSSHWDFLRTATKNGAISYHLASQKCIAVPVENRQEFFNDSRTGFALAYAVMLGATPSMNKDFLSFIGLDITLGSRSNKFLIALLRKERINTNMSILYSYANEETGSFGSTINPFETIYTTIFRLTVNTMRGGRKATTTRPDAISHRRRTVFDRDHSGIVNTGIVAAYLLCDLATHPEHLTEVREELDRFVSSFSSDESVPCISRLHSITYEDWITPSNLPVLDRCLKETLRLRIATPLHRLNDSGKDIEMGGILVPNKTTILSFHSSFMHHSEEIYTEPLAWDPARFGNTTERKTSRRQCLSVDGVWADIHALICRSCLHLYLSLIQFAKFEIFLLTALMVSSYDMQTVDKSGRSMTEMPPVELNSTVISPPTPEVHLRLSKR
ncbi:cytochrome P450 [Mycena rebaudengoi]|nr:cytochrome P450 [Mycena rebaudengoi]